ncbi:hypothetical protein CSB08_00695 [Candidatus Gracilibacteria bacterium]|nr:MAG: hypothetical protein CSB08_00695 [Candidatus Gracilibacteria bacterium]PIE85753.1 MAG: hypothetical protein CSA08_00565 [Candidatus Gracilibacteria bacterium]
MNTKRILLLIITFVFTSGIASGDYSEVECSSDPSFEAYSCNQCFNGGTKAQGDNIGLLSDDWVNSTSSSQLIYKEEQEDPEMINLGGGDSSWSEVKSGETFWEYTKELNDLYSEDDGGYILAPGSKVTWLSSKLDSAYSLDKNTAETGKNIGMLVYPIAVHNVLSDGDVTIDADIHNECVLFKSGESTGTEVNTTINKTPNNLPNTGPEHILLVLLSLVIPVLIMRRRK